MPWSNPTTTYNLTPVRSTHNRLADSPAHPQEADYATRKSDRRRGICHPAVFRECVARREPSEQFFGSMVGQFSALERNSIEPMALQVDGGSVRALQRRISDVVWEEVQMRRTYHRLLHDDLGDAEGVLMFDESGFPKKGRESVGVARQDCGTLGQVENGQVGVFAA